jgi:ribulose 1,5-bisphosphate synthetase/thiazole synthase
VDKRVFGAGGEKDLNRAIVTEFARQLNEYVESDCIIVGAGPAVACALGVVA